MGVGVPASAATEDIKKKNVARMNELTILGPSREVAIADVSYSAFDLICNADPHA
jgi:hypothetical protein